MFSVGRIKGTDNMQTVKHAIAIVRSCKNNKNKRKNDKSKKKRHKNIERWKLWKFKFRSLKNENLNKFGINEKRTQVLQAYNWKLINGMLSQKTEKLRKQIKRQKKNMNIVREELTPEF